MTITTKTDFPSSVKEIENLWIPLSDGTKLAARMWLPVDAEENPVPALLEYLPYRKRDGTHVRDALTHPYFAGHGYAAIRVDMRGNNYYWLGFKRERGNPPVGTDLWAAFNRRISVTPLHMNLTQLEAMDAVRAVLDEK